VDSDSDFDPNTLELFDDTDVASYSSHIESEEDDGIEDEDDMGTCAIR
jgi:hypothetical protein